MDVLANAFILIITITITNLRNKQGLKSRTVMA